MREALVRIIKTLSWVTLGASLLGVALQCDAQAADALAPKAFWFAVAASLIPALAVLKLWQGASLTLPRGRWVLGLGALLGMQTLAYWVSPLRLHAVGAWQAWMLSALLLLGLVDLLEGEAAWLRALRWLSAVAFLAGLWSVAQAFGLDHTAMGVACREAFGARIAGSLGNPNFAGGFFVLLLPVLAWSARRDPLRRARCLGWAALGFSAAALWLSASKAALLGLGAEVAVAAHLFFWSDAPAALKRKGMQGVALALGALLLFGALVLPPVSRERLVQGWQPGAESVQFRQLTWRGALNAALERPWLGWGPGNFAVVYPSHRLTAATAGLVQRSYEVSHAENWAVQTLVESGAFGLAALIAFLLLLLWPLRSVAKAWAAEDLRGSLAVALLSALLGSLVCNFASLDIFLPSTLLPFLVLAAVGAGVAGQPGFSFRLNAEPYARVLVSLGLALFASVPPVQAQMQWNASRDLETAKALSSAGRFDEAIPVYQRALLLHPGNLEARYFLASSFQDRAKGDDLQQAAAAYEQLRRQAPDYVLVHAKLARLYQAQGRSLEAAAEWERQRRLDPYLLQGIQELSTLYASQGRLEEAARVLREGTQRFPDDAGMRKNLRTVEQALAKKGAR